MNKIMLVMIGALLIFSILFAASAPILVSAAGNGNGSGGGNNGSGSGDNGSGAGNGTDANGQNGSNGGSGQGNQTGSSYGPGPGNQNKASYGSGPKYRTGSGGGQRNPGAGNGQPGGGLALGPLSEAEIQGLVNALLEEYTARATYQKVLDTLGDVAPFNQIVLAEAQHASVLEGMASKYGVTLPQPPNPAALPVYVSLQEACQAGVQLETEDAALYDGLKQVTVHADLLQVYTNLQSASLYNHLPAFQACQ